MSTVLATSRADRIAELDGLRGIAIAVVLWHHLVERALPPVSVSSLGWLRIATNLSWSGVDLFFVLSGYFIVGILIDQRESPQLARVFYRRRAARVLPLYFATLAVTFALIVARVPGSFHSFPAWIYATFFTNLALAATGTWDWLPLSVLWSLAVEEQFYIAAPWVVRAIAPARLPRFLAGLAIFALVARCLLVAAYPDGYFGAHVLTPLRMDGLALGALVAWAVRSESARGFFTWLALRWAPLLALGGAAIAALSLSRPLEGAPVLCVVGYSLLAVVFALVLAIVAGVRPRALTRFLAARPLAHLGRHSYFVYLWHTLVGAAVFQVLGASDFLGAPLSALLKVAVTVALTWTAATLSWKFFEGPLVAWGHRLAY